MGKWIRERIDSKGRCPKPEGGRQRTADSGPRAEDGNQQAAPPNKRICAYCAYACWMRRGPSFLMGMNLRRPLVCLNHPDAPGESREVLGNSTCPNFLARRDSPHDGVKFITLTKGQHTLVDAADFEWLNPHRWFAVPNPNGSGYYAARSDNGRIIFMHREIMKAADNMVVDHANRCPADNRRCNLRVCTPQQNVYNRRSRAHSSQYQGVSYAKTWGKWVVQIKLNKRSEHIGAFDDEVEAAQVRDRWAFAFRGRFAYLNFPEDFASKDPNDPEFQALRDQLTEKRRKREARKKAREERQKSKGKGKKGKRKK
jgi:hypothetical protein